MILGLYTRIVLTQAKGFLMIIFAYTVLEYSREDNRDYTSDRQGLQDLYNETSRILFNAGWKTIERSNRNYYRCDPDEHIEGETFTQFDKTFQGIFLTEIDIFENCLRSDPCQRYELMSQDNSKICHLDKRKDALCKRQTGCAGIIRDCIPASHHKQACLSSSLSRRYDWIATENGLFQGKGRPCNDSYEFGTFLFNNHQCDTCFCICEDQRSNDKFISMVEYFSDIQENKVITGLRFVKKNRIVEIEIQQGRAIPHGHVDKETVEWVETEPLDFNKNFDRIYTIGTHKNILFLPHLEGRYSHVVTGIRFVEDKFGRTVFLNLEIFMTLIDFETGKLNEDISFWDTKVSPMPMAEYYETWQFVQDVPTLANESHVIDPPDQYTKFYTTDYSMDISQVTIPFVDLQPVVTSPPTWLSEVQLVCKRQNNYGGFLGFQIFHHELSDLIKDKEL